MSYFNNPSRRLIVLLTILWINPFFSVPGILSRSIQDTLPSAHSEQLVSLNNGYTYSPEEEMTSHGFLGCKYDSDLCNGNEVCLDDHLFGQCWRNDEVPLDFEHSRSTSDRLSTRKFQILRYTFHVLKYLHLTWKDRATQCILSEIIFSPKHLWLDRLHLKLMYKYCFNEQQYAVVREKFRRQHHTSNILDKAQQLYSPLPYAASKRSLQFLLDLDVPSDILASVDNDQSFPSMISHKNDVNVKASASFPAEISVFNQLSTDQSSMNHPSSFESTSAKNNQSFLEILSQEKMKDPLVKDLSNDEDKVKRGYIIIDRDFKSQDEASQLISHIARLGHWPRTIFASLSLDHHVLIYDLNKDENELDANDVINIIINHQKVIEDDLDIAILDIGIGHPNTANHLEEHDGTQLTVVLWVILTLVFFLGSIFVSFCYVARNERLRLKLMDGNQLHPTSSYDSTTYLCQSPIYEVTMEKASQKSSMNARTKFNIPDDPVDSPASSATNSETSSPKEDLFPINLDIHTGHLILSYMEDHLRDRQRLQMEWEKLCLDENKNESASFDSIALSETNMKKNHYCDCIPYDHARIQLVDADDDNSDYINASPISDSGPKCKYIATQGPMANTTNAFWQMVWEQGSCVIVTLARPIENGQTMYHHYWPVLGTARFNDYEVNLVSEHSWSVDYLVRSFYLKNIQTMETRTVTQFHFLTWEESSRPPSVKAVLEFRRKVNKSFHGRSSPIIVHCNDGVGRTGTYILIDMILNGICKGVREIDIAATLEHLRDQRAKMVKTKDQYEFVFTAVAEEISTLLKAMKE